MSLGTASPKTRKSQQAEVPDSETLKEVRKAQEEFFKTFRELQVIAQRVGGDWGMSVKIGQPGGGSFHNPDDRSITLDPLHIIEDPEFAKFVTGHEGSHRATMCKYDELGYEKSQIEALYNQIGFGFGQNITEDGACNDWKDRSFIGLEPGSRIFYEKQFADNDAVLSTPDVNQIAQRIGRMPLFARYGSEILRDWNELRKKYGVEKPLPLDEPGHFSPTIPIEVKEALDRSIKAARECINNIPPPLCRSKPQIKQAHQKRFITNTNHVYPEIQALAEKDLGIETGRQAYNDFRQKLDQLGELEKQLKTAKTQKDQSGQATLQQQIDQLKQELDPYNSIPQSVRDEIERQIQESIKKQLRDFANKLEKSANEIGDSKAKQAELEKELSKLQSSQKSGAEESEDIKDLKQALDLEKAREEAAKSKLEQTLKQSIHQNASGQQLSDELKQAVEQAAEEKAKSQENQKGQSAQDKKNKDSGKQQGAEGKEQGSQRQGSQDQSGAQQSGAGSQEAAGDGSESGGESNSQQGAGNQGQSGQGQSGQGQSGQGQAGGAGQGQSGQGQSGQGQAGGAGQGQSGQGQAGGAGQGQSGQGQSGQGQSGGAGQGQAGQGQSGQGQAGGAGQGSQAPSGAQQSGTAPQGNGSKDQGQSQSALSDKILDKVGEAVANDRKAQGQLPLPFEDLSPQAQQEIAKMVDKLPEPQFNDCKDRAEKELKNFEKAANEEIGSKLGEQAGKDGKEGEGSEGDSGDADSKDGKGKGNKSKDSKSAQSGKGSGESNQGGSGNSSGDVDGLESYKPVNYRPKSTEPGKAKIRESSKKREEPEEDRLKAIAKEQKEIEKITHAVSNDPEEFILAESQIEEPLTTLKRAFRRALRPTLDQELVSGRANGKLDVNKAMRVSREPNLVTELFQQYIEPLKIDHAFGTLVDRSGSMGGERCWEAYKGAVLQSKLLDWERLKIPNAVWTFDDRTYKAKDFGEKIQSDEVKRRLGSILQVTGGTNDAPAIRAMYKELLNRKEKFKFLVVITDAGSGVPADLAKVIAQIKRDGKVIIVHFGLGEGTSDGNGVYPYSFGDLSVSDTENGRSFAKVYKAFIEAAVRKADRFFDYRSTDDIINAIERKAFGD